MSEKSISIAKANELITGALSGRYKVIQDNRPSNYGEEVSQGTVSDIRKTVYDPKDGSGLFVQISRYTDSYGEHEEVTGVKICVPVEKKVIVYE